MWIYGLNKFEYNRDRERSLKAESASKISGVGTGYFDIDVTLEIDMLT